MGRGSLVTLLIYHIISLGLKMVEISRLEACKHPIMPSKGFLSI